MTLQHVLMAAILTATASAAAAQTAPVKSPIARGDVSGTLGWFHANKSEASRERYNDWYNSSLYGGIGAGWYWTDHHKTEIDFGGTTEGDIYTSWPLVVENLNTYRSSRFFYSTRKLAISQQYQAYRNVWFHPHVAAGVDLTWETTREEQSPVFSFDNVSRTSRQVLPPAKVGPDVDMVVRPFAAVGFKAYMTPRGFFRTDMRFVFKGGIDEVLWRVGFGVDF